MFTKQKPDDPQPQQAAPTDDPEPAKAGPDGFLSREWVAWESRQAERRLLGGRPPKLSDATRDLLSRWDATIEDANQAVQASARRKHEIEAEIASATSPESRFGPGGRVIEGLLNVGKVDRLRREHAAAVARLQECKDLEGRLRADRNDWASGRMTFTARPDNPSIHRPDDGSTAYSYNQTTLRDGVARR